MQLGPNINSLQALGNLCFHKHKNWVISRFAVIQMQRDGGHQQKRNARTRGRSHGHPERKCLPTGGHSGAVKTS